ncbi:hypothetical protein GBP13_05890 [Pediococcus acidilactici]|uniref:hypothetical protein n=1 Tax=Pediococcus acidilactici TaxID=1254 RepID=UPI001329E463|nr:hypothetical protein [Pediococcus acidilactici]KAF0363713.1 hypothetical protein GBO50_05885 [Pediococcus acidilactici]KAF0367469.1 hypothetical protein GBO55_06585 [Pediococcus acidilactici]KAF0418433.1 hypothetical protein GBO80_06015 [Pediococcus acidilactici]KAF0421424.1 hypothetical protein GBO82_06010 [Pediococcus acidilactici]KAF0473971.1 hypothetical protein GBP08_05890 [Pediococcus acidilactici]
MDEKIQTSLKLLQDLKFWIYKLSDYRVDFRNFGILTFEVRGTVINLDNIVRSKKNDYTIEEIAWSLVKEYHL